MRWAFIVVLAALAMGCTRTAQTVTDGRHPWTQAHVLRLADVADPDSLNPLLSTMDLSYDLSSLLFSYLVIVDRSGHASVLRRRTEPGIAAAAGRHRTADHGC